MASHDDDSDDQAPDSGDRDSQPDSGDAPEENDRAGLEQSENAEHDDADEAPAKTATRKSDRSAKRAATTPGERQVTLKIRRQDSADKPETRRWEEFQISARPRMSVAGALREIQKQSGASLAWEGSCLEEVCGACSMLINGRVRQACSALLDDVSPSGKPISVEPLSKFPLIRDLVVDRSRMFDSLKRIKAWVEIDGTQRLTETRQSPADQAEVYPLARCTGCGACLEACPEFSEHNDFVGAAALNQVRRLNLHPGGKQQKVERLESVMAPGGVADCGKAQNCVEVCPAGVPLVDSIQIVARDTSKHLLFGWLLK